MTGLNEDIDPKFFISLEDLFNSQTSPEYTQLHVQDTDMYRSYQEAVASATAP